MRANTTSTTLLSHPNDNMTLMVSSATELLSSYQESHRYHAVLWRREDDRAKYLDIFNNISGHRTLMGEIQTPDTEAGSNIITATLEHGITGPITYRFGDNHPKSTLHIQKFLQLIQELPFLRNDIELGIRHVWNRHTPKIAVHILNEYPHNDYRRPVLPDAKDYHVDMGRSAYIQIGGAGMECLGTDFYNKLPHIPTREQVQTDFLTPDSVYFITDDELPEETLRKSFLLNAADFLLFRGLSEESALVHRSPSDKDTMKSGRLAINIYPTA